MAIVRTEEVAGGWEPGPVLDQRSQAREGCDFLSTPPDGGPPHPVEVKGWGAPLLDAKEGFTFPAELLNEQHDCAKRDPNFRLEIVANLTAAREGIGEPQRLTLRPAEILERASPCLYEVDLAGLEDRVRP